MYDVGLAAIRARGRNRRGNAANMALRKMFIGVQSERHETALANSRPAAVGAESGAGAAAAVVKKQGLALVFEGVFDTSYERVGQKAVAREIQPRCHIDNSDVRRRGRLGALR